MTENKKRKMKKILLEIEYDSCQEYLLSQIGRIEEVKVYRVWNEEAKKYE